MSVFRVDRHLASPILDGELQLVRQFASQPEKLKAEHRALPRDYQELVLNYNWMDFQRDLVRHILTTRPYSADHEPMIGPVLAAACRAYKVGMADLSRNTEPAQWIELSPADI